MRIARYAVDNNRVRVVREERRRGREHHGHEERNQDDRSDDVEERMGEGSLPAGRQGTLTWQDLPALHRGLKPRLPRRGLTLTADCPWVQGHFSAAGLEFLEELEARGQVVKVCTPSLGGMHGLTLLDEGNVNTLPPPAGEASHQDVLAWSLQMSLGGVTAGPLRPGHLAVPL